MLRLMQYEALKHLLLAATDVLSLFEHHRPGFDTVVVGWLGQVAEELGNNRMAVASWVAALRAELLVSTGTDSRSMTARRRQRSREAVAAVNQTVTMLSDELDASRVRFAEAAGACRHALAIAVGTGVLADTGVPVEQVFAILEHDPNTVGGMIQLIGSVGANDALMIISQSLVDIR